jgi:hypothetical protein
MFSIYQEEILKNGTIPIIDVLCPKAPYGFDAVFAWSFEITAVDLGVGDHDIMLRNADFVTP